MNQEIKEQVPFCRQPCDNLLAVQLCDITSGEVLANAELHLQPNRELRFLELCGCYLLLKQDRMCLRIYDLIENVENRIQGTRSYLPLAVTFFPPLPRMNLDLDGNVMMRRQKPSKASTLFVAAHENYLDLCVCDNGKLRILSRIAVERINPAVDVFQTVGEDTTPLLLIYSRNGHIANGAYSTCRVPVDRNTADDASSPLPGLCCALLKTGSSTTVKAEAVLPLSRKTPADDLPVHGTWGVKDPRQKSCSPFNAIRRSDGGVYKATASTPSKLAFPAAETPKKNNALNKRFYCECANPFNSDGTLRSKRTADVHCEEGAGRDEFTSEASTRTSLDSNSKRLPDRWSKKLVRVHSENEIAGHVGCERRPLKRRRWIGTFVSNYNVAMTDKLIKAGVFSASTTELKIASEQKWPSQIIVRPYDNDENNEQRCNGISSADNLLSNALHRPRFLRRRERRNFHRSTPRRVLRSHSVKCCTTQVKAQIYATPSPLKNGVPKPEMAKPELSSALYVVNLRDATNPVLKRVPLNCCVDSEVHVLIYDPLRREVLLGNSSGLHRIRSTFSKIRH